MVILKKGEGEGKSSLEESRKGVRASCPLSKGGKPRLGGGPSKKEKRPMGACDEKGGAAKIS